MTTRLILGALTLSASLLAQAARAQSAAKPMLATHTVERETETGSWRAGDAMVWVRVAPTGAISVFASHGYRSAFAHAVIMTPEDADKWADMGEHMLAGQAPPAGATMLADSDVALEPTRAGDSTVLAVRLGGLRPDGITFLMNGQSLREVTPILRATAKQSRASQAASAAPPAPAPAPSPTPATPAAAPAAAAPAPAAPAPTPATPTTTPPAPHMAVVDSPPPPPAPVIVATASVPSVPPEAATPDTPAPKPEAEVAPVVPVAVAPVTPTPVVATRTSTALPVVAQTKIVNVTKPKPVPEPTVSASLRRTSAGSIAKPAAARVTTDESSDAAKLSASTVANLVKQWQSQLDLCYTEFGLKVDPALTGSIAVRLAIRPSGEVGAATFARHHWSGAGGKEAESCMHARVMAWMFPPASVPSAHEFTVAFAP